MLNINNEVWKIFLVPTHHPSLARSDGVYSIGACDDNLKAIFLNENLNSEKMKRVLCHEIVHAVMFSYNIFVDYEVEEILADLVATYGQEIISLTNHSMWKIKKWGA